MGDELPASLAFSEPMNKLLSEQEIEDPVTLENENDTPITLKAFQSTVGMELSIGVVVEATCEQMKSEGFHQWIEVCVKPRFQPGAPTGITYQNGES